MEDNILGTQKVPKLFAMYSIPAIVAMLVVGTQSIIDGLFVGNYVGENAMASVNIAQPFMQMIIGTAMVIVIGSLSYMGRTLGEKDKEKTQNIYRTSLILLISVAGFLTLVGALLSEPIALFLGASEILVADTALYIKTISVFLIPMFLMYQFAFANRLLEKPDLYFKGMILSLVVNIALNIVLVKSMGLGVFGTAIASGLAEPFALCYVIGPHLNRKNPINIFSGKYDKTVIIPVVSNGASEAMGAIATAITAYIFNMAFMKGYGENGVASYTIISYITLFSTYIMFGIADGIGPLISYSYGARNFKRVKEVMKFSYGVASVIGISLFLVLILFGEHLARLFISNNTEILKIATAGIKIFAVGHVVMGLNILTAAYFTALGKAKESLVIALSRGLVFVLIGILILPQLFSMKGVLMVMPFAELLTVVMCYGMLKKIRL